MVRPLLNLQYLPKTTAEGFLHPLQVLINDLGLHVGNESGKLSMFQFLKQVHCVLQIDMTSAAEHGLRRLPRRPSTTRPIWNGRGIHFIIGDKSRMTHEVMRYR